MYSVTSQDRGYPWEGVVTKRGQEVGLWGGNNLLFLNLDLGYTGVLSLEKFIELYICG